MRQLALQLIDGRWRKVGFIGRPRGDEGASARSTSCLERRVHGGRLCLARHLVRFLSWVAVGVGVGHSRLSSFGRVLVGFFIITPRTRESEEYTLFKTRRLRKRERERRETHILGFFFSTRVGGMEEGIVKKKPPTALVESLVHMPDEGRNKGVGPAPSSPPPPIVRVIEPVPGAKMAFLIQCLT